MTGMIGHHAQAVKIAGWAPTHGASPSVVTLTERIVVGQQDEIVLMETWLRKTGAADARTPTTAHAMMPGMDHSMHMPGMLNAAQLDTLDAARGAAFDRYFLIYMIQHHMGAIVMVNELFATPGRGAGRTTRSVWPRTSTPTRPPKSPGCRRCSRRSRSGQRPMNRLDRRTSASLTNLSQEWSMALVHQVTYLGRRASAALVPLALAFGALTAAGCASSTSSKAATAMPPRRRCQPIPAWGSRRVSGTPAQAAWNLTLVSTTRPSESFVGITNSDISFTGNYVIQGSYNGFQVWDVSNPAKPTLKVGYLCPASQSDVSVYKNLLFVSGEGNPGRLDCGTQGVKDTVSAERLRGIRIFDITDIAAPEVHRQRADLPRIAHPHACWPTRTTRPTSTSMSRVPPASARRANCRAAPTWRRARTRTPRSSGLKSSRCRWRIRNRPPS